MRNSPPRRRNSCALNEHLEDLVQQRTAALEGEIAKREAAQAALGASETRYRRL